MAVGAITVVIVAVLASVTLLPALLAVVGGRIEGLRVLLPRRKTAESGRFWQDWTNRVLARPYLSLARSGVQRSRSWPSHSCRCTRRAGHWSSFRRIRRCAQRPSTSSAWSARASRARPT